MRDGWGIAVVMTVVVALAVSRFREVDVDVLPLCSASDEIPVAADIANRFRPFVWIKTTVGRDEIASTNDFDVLLRIVFVEEHAVGFSIEAGEVERQFRFGQRDIRLGGIDFAARIGLDFVNKVVDVHGSRFCYLRQSLPSHFHC